MLLPTEGSPASNDRSPSADSRSDRTPDGDEKSNIGATLARRAQSERISERSGASSRDTEAGTDGIRALWAARVPRLHGRLTGTRLDTHGSLTSGTARVFCGAGVWCEGLGGLG